MNWRDDVLTVDNALHALVAVAFVVAVGWFAPWDPLYAALAGYDPEGIGS